MTICPLAGLEDHRTTQQGIQQVVDHFMYTVRHAWIHHSLVSGIRSVRAAAMSRQPPANRMALPGMLPRKVE